MLGKCHYFMIPNGYDFPQKDSKIYTQVTISTFKKIKPVFIMLVFKNLRTADSPLLILTNQVLLLLLLLLFN